jgi:3-methyladenine DNA glycosylase/8-oxoguanine DNA glycosylase
VKSRDRRFDGVFYTAAAAQRAGFRACQHGCGCRGTSLVALCAALARTRSRSTAGADRCEVRRVLLDLPGIGIWTADYIAIYIAMRALRDPDVFLPTDAGARSARTTRR